MGGAERLQETAKRALPRWLGHRRVDALLYHFLFAGDAYPDLRPPVHRHDGGTWGAGEVFDHLPIGLPRGRVGRSRGVGGVRLGGGRGRGLGSGWIEEQLDPRLPAFVSCHVLSKARPSPRASHGSGHGSGRHLALVTSSTATKAESMAPLVFREFDAVFIHLDLAFLPLCVQRSKASMGRRYSMLRGYSLPRPSILTRFSFPALSRSPLSRRSLSPHRSSSTRIFHIHAPFFHTHHTPLKKISFLSLSRKKNKYFTFLYLSPSMNFEI